MTEKTFGQVIKARREKKGWTQSHLVSKFISPSISEAYIKLVENKGEIPSIPRILQLADIFGISRDSLWKVAKEEKLRIYAAKLDEVYQRTLKIFKERKG